MLSGCARYDLITRDAVTKVMMFLLYYNIKLTTTNSILTISLRNGKIDTVWPDVAMLCQTTSRQNFVNVTISKHVTAEQENVFIVFIFFFYLVFSPKHSKEL